MGVPPYDLGYVLPPFLGPQPGRSALQSPYEASTEEIVHRFGTSPARNGLLRGLLNLRASLAVIGIVEGYQWIDGSFVEDKEARTGSPPGDIDVVTIFKRPSGYEDRTRWRQFASTHSALFDPKHCKASFGCEAFYIDGGLDGLAKASQSAFWFGLFSHQRDTLRWKGVVRCALGSGHEDKAASDELTRRGF